MMTYPDPKNGQMYYFAMNGENGKVCGVLPVDSKKLVRLFLTIFHSCVCTFCCWEDT